MGLLQRAPAWLRTQVSASGGRLVTYSRTDDVERGLVAGSVSLIATPGDYLFAVSASLDKARVEWADRDYLIEAALLILNGARVEPEKGDRVTETIDGTVCVYELSTPTNEPVWRWADTEHVTLRVHCKRVA